MKKLHTLLFSASLLMGVAAHAQLRVEIAGVSGTQIPVAVAAFADESIAPDQVSAIIRADLERSGVFKVIDAGRAISDSASIDLGAFKASGADALVVGSVSRLPDGRFQVRYKLLDTVKQTQLSQLSDAVGARNTRLEAHRIADDVYEKLTGVRGIFSTRISYVKMNRSGGNHNYELVVADADGENEQVAAFGREADHLAGLVAGRHQGRLCLLREAKADRLRAEPGDRPARHHFQRKGQQLGAGLVAGRQQAGPVAVEDRQYPGLHRECRRQRPAPPEHQQRHRYRTAILGDGQSIYFVSDRSGGPQIYKMSINGGQATRVTFNGSYNISPRLSPDGKTLAWISQRDGGFSTSMRWTWPAARNSAWPMGPLNRVFRQTASTSCMPTRAAGVPRWLWCPSMDA
jgi:TolB protein